MSKYGAHIFHTKYPRVWEYVNRFSEWIPYEHKVKGRVKDVNETFKIVPIPPNRVSFSINLFFQMTKKYSSGLCQFIIWN